LKKKRKNNIGTIAHKGIIILFINMNKITKTIYSDTYKHQRELMDKSEVNKLEQAIEVHGYRGASKFKHNGVVNIKPDDKELWKSLEKFKQLEKELLLETKENSEDFFIDVKIVAHVPNGNRIIGSLYKNSNNELVLYVLGFSNYNYQLF